MTNPDRILEVRNVSVRFPTSGGNTVKAVSDVSFSIRRGEVFGLVGESGSGKTTLGKAVIRLNDLHSGTVLFDGVDIHALHEDDLRRLRSRMQIIFQDPFGSLNPRMTVEGHLDEAITLVDRKKEASEHITELLDLVGLPSSARSRYPHEFSGGQRQRICIARALAVEPEFIVADEPVAALDVSIQAQIVNLLQDLQRELNLTMLFIAHDLAVVRHISDRIGVMYLGRLQEVGPADDIVSRPAHPYTRALLSAVPIPDPSVRRSRTILEGDLPSPIDPPSGCVFRTRCPEADVACATEIPVIRPLGTDREAACLKL